MSDLAMPSEPSEQQWMEIQAALFAGHKIQAIKLYRQAAGVGLKEAKDAMDAYETKLRSEAPDRFAAAPSKGCSSMILLFVAMVGGGWFVMKMFA